MDDLVKKERKIVQNLATSWLFLRKILATLARISLQIGYFELPTVGNTAATGEIPCKCGEIMCYFLT